MKTLTENGIDFFIAEQGGYITETAPVDEESRSFGRIVQVIPSLVDYWRDATEKEISDYVARLNENSMSNI